MVPAPTARTLAVSENRHTIHKVRQTTRETDSHDASSPNQLLNPMTSTEQELSCLLAAMSSFGLMQQMKLKPLCFNLTMGASNCVLNLDPTELIESFPMLDVVVVVVVVFIAVRFFLETAEVVVDVFVENNFFNNTCFV